MFVPMVHNKRFSNTFFSSRPIKLFWVALSFLLGKWSHLCLYHNFTDWCLYEVAEKQMFCKMFSIFTKTPTLAKNEKFGPKNLF